MRTPRAVVLGLDGATLRLVEPWAAAGLLPNLSALMESGSRGVLRSTIPATTPLAWPSIYTGCGPGKHGIFGFYRRKEGTYEWAKSSRVDLKRPAIWDVLGSQGLRCGVFFVPYTYPAYPLEGVMVTGRGGSEDLSARISHPPELAGDLVDTFGRLAVLGKRRAVENVLGEVADDLEMAVRGKTDVIAHVVGREELDFVFAVWDHTDTVAHLFWHYTDLPVPDEGSPVFRIYKAVDDGIGRVLDAAGGDPIVIACSDHGTYPVNYRVRVAPWLESEGFLHMTRSGQDRALAAAASASKKVPSKLRGLLPVRRLRRFKRRFQPTVDDALDWNRTKIYPQRATAESLYVNLVGREPDGYVKPADMVGVVEQLSDSLRDAVTPDGERFVDKVHRGLEVYDGPERERGPDVVIEAKLGYMLAPSRLGERETFWKPPVPDLAQDPPRSICYHDPEGLIVAAGPGIKKGVRIDGDCTDVTPTLLALLGLEGPEGMDGRPIQLGTQRLQEPPVMASPVEAGVRDEALTAEEEASIESQLKDLGYID